MKYLFVAFLLMICQQTHALDWRDSPAIGKLFADAGVQGTFVLYDADAKAFIGHDRVRAETRFVPGSTFKIANSLIGLSVGAVKDVDEVLPYGGKPQPFKAWERDMSLREAIKISNVPVYQELARRISLDRMRRGVAAPDYGNGEIGDVVDRFWLRGPLQISAVEQTVFLARLAQGELSFPQDVQEQVRDIIRMERGDGWILYGRPAGSTPPNRA
ncbi:MAG: penicillin-binding transpeptidase domain-containing protein [Methylomonas sp.]|nr:penicillin-binding transpeptidase domain-containing protein [Methylomonas sp.]